MAKPQSLSGELVLRNVVEYLIQCGKNEAAALLVETEIDEIQKTRFFMDEEWVPHYLEVTLSAPHGIVPLLGSSDVQDWFNLPDENYGQQYPLQYSVQQGFEAVLREKPVLYQTYVQLITESEDDWRDHLREMAKGEATTNQGRQFKQSDPIFPWNNLNFRSREERLIAQELDKRDILFFPNCAARLGTPGNRHTKEPDFLICRNGKWGILQVDGWFHHRHTVAQDQNIDRQFDLYGIRVIQRFTGEQCGKEPDKVVEIFLDRLERNG